MTLRRRLLSVLDARLGSRRSRRLRLCASGVLAGVALLAVFGGCEAIVSNDVPAYTCHMVPYVDPGVGSCPAGEFCQGSGCAPCEARDICDGYDNDCDGKIDDGTYSDHDSDGYTVCGQQNDVTGALEDVDCNDNDPAIHPNAQEVCNGKDDNCDGIIDNPNLVCPPDETCVPAAGACVPNAQACTPANCPAPKVCDPNSNACVQPNQDAGTTCSGNKACASGICATSTELGSGQSSVCTTPCCTSADCGTGNVCFGAGTGGNYCVPMANVNIAAVGSGAPGAQCGSGGDCRSGVCVNGACEDTCCNDTSCTNGTTCSVSTLDGAQTLACVPPTGTVGTNQTCSQNSDCASGFCAEYQDNFGNTYKGCAQPCCSSHQCGTFSSQSRFGSVSSQLVCYDDYLPPATSGFVVPVCDNPQETNNQGSTPTGQVGTACQKATDCFSNQCQEFTTGTNTTASFCTDVCCVDSDCGTAGWVCQPFPVGNGTYLRCVPQGSD